MTYVFQMSYVRMTMPSRLSCSPRWSASFSATAAMDLRSRFLSLLRRGGLVVDLHLRVVLDGADHLIGAGDDLVAVLQAAEDFDIGCAGNAGFHLTELRFLSGNHEHALNLFLLRLFSGRIGLDLSRSAFRAGGFGFEVAPLPDGQRLNRYS